VLTLSPLLARRSCVVTSPPDAPDSVARPVSDVTIERQRAIVRLLAQNGRIAVTAIAERFGISPATARRDAVFLAETGKAVRAHGGLLPAPAPRGEQPFRTRELVHRGTKAHLALRAAELLPGAGNVFVDAGTTCLEVGRLLGMRPGLRIYTNSIPLLASAGGAAAAIVAIGGEARKSSLALTGGFAQAWLADVRFDAAVFGASGLDLTNGVYTSEIHEAAVKMEALRRSTLRVLVADADKWNRPTAVRFAPWNAFTWLVTNQDLPREALRCLAASHVALRLTGLPQRPGGVSHYP
jgi:DeoR family fructose operon transcriptional repressor